METTTSGAQLAMRLPSSGWLARESRGFGLDITVLFVLDSASTGTKQLMLLLMVMAEQSRKRQLTADDEMDVKKNTPAVASSRLPLAF